MRRLTKWIGGTAAGIAAYRLLRRRKVQPEPALAPASTEPDTRADELREKLAESRTSEPETQPDTEEPVAAEEPDTPEDRRQRVHEEGRAALDDMRSENAD